MSEDNNNNMSKLLDLGCGRKKRAGSVGVDINKQSQADVIHDLNSFPYPFKDSQFENIYIDNTLEHLDNVVEVIEEVHRIAKNNAEIVIIVPYFRSRWAFIDPTHKHYFSVDSFSYFDPRHPFCQNYNYSQAKFKVKKRVFNNSLNNSFFKKIILGIANRWPGGYELYLSHLYPLDDITFYLKLIK